MYIDRQSGKFIYKNTLPELDNNGILSKKAHNSLRLTPNFQHFIGAIGLTGQFAMVLRSMSNSLIK